MFNNSVIGRLKRGATHEQASAEAAAIAKQIVADVYPAQLRETGFAPTALVKPMRDDIVGRVQRVLVVLLAAVGVLLLIACADIACLMLTRAAARAREMAIRTALGAGRGRVMRLMLVETGVLAVLGGAWRPRACVDGASAALLVSLASDLPRAREVGLDGRVLAFTAVIALAATIVCGLLPALEVVDAAIPPGR